MKKMSKLGTALVIMISIAACSGGGGNRPPDQTGISTGTLPENATGAKQYSFRGVVQKGPFLRDSNIYIYGMSIVDGKLVQTGEPVLTKTTDDNGSFSVTANLSTNLAEFVAEGYYMDETKSPIARSDAPITLRALAEVSCSTNCNVNILTTLARDVVAEQIALASAPDQTDTAAFETAREIAEPIVLNSFNISPIIMQGHFNEWDLMRAGDANAILAAASINIAAGRNADEVARALVAQSLAPGSQLSNRIIDLNQVKINLANLGSSATLDNLVSDSFGNIYVKTSELPASTDNTAPTSSTGSTSTDNAVSTSSTGSTSTGNEAITEPMTFEIGEPSGIVTDGVVDSNGNVLCSAESDRNCGVATVMVEGKNIPNGESIGFTVRATIDDVSYADVKNYVGLDSNEFTLDSVAYGKAITIFPVYQFDGLRGNKNVHISVAPKEDTTISVLHADVPFVDYNEKFIFRNLLDLHALSDGINTDGKYVNILTDGGCTSNPKSEWYYQSTHTIPPCALYFTFCLNYIPEDGTTIDFVAKATIEGVANADYATLDAYEFPLDATTSCKDVALLSTYKYGATRPDKTIHITVTPKDNSSASGYIPAFDVSFSDFDERSVIFPENPELSPVILPISQLSDKLGESNSKYIITFPISTYPEGTTVHYFVDNKNEYSGGNFPPPSDPRWIVYQGPFDIRDNNLGGPYMKGDSIAGDGRDACDVVSPRIDCHWERYSLNYYTSFGGQNSRAVDIQDVEFTYYALTNAFEINNNIKLPVNSHLEITPSTDTPGISLPNSKIYMTLTADPGMDIYYTLDTNHMDSPLWTPPHPTSSAPWIKYTVPFDVTALGEPYSEGLANPGMSDSCDRLTSTSSRCYCKNYHLLAFAGSGRQSSEVTAFGYQSICYVVPVTP